MRQDDRKIKNEKGGGGGVVERRRKGRWETLRDIEDGL